MAGRLGGKGIPPPEPLGCRARRQTTRMRVRTLNPSWTQPSRSQNLPAMKVPILRESLGFTCPPLAGFPHPCHLGSSGTGNEDWKSGVCIDCYCIPDGLAHCMNVPCRDATAQWRFSAYCFRVVHTEHGCKGLHNIPPWSRRRDATAGADALITTESTNTPSWNSGLTPTVTTGTLLRPDLLCTGVALVQCSRSRRRGSDTWLSLQGGQVHGCLDWCWCWPGQQRVHLSPQ